MSKHQKPGSPSGKPSGPNPPQGTDPIEVEFLLDEPSASPASSQRSNPAEGDIGFEEQNQRPQPRQKLPDQRRDKVSFELGGPTTGPKEEPVPPSFNPDLFESNAPAVAGAGGWEPATPDEIENYDLSGGTSPAPPKVEPPVVKPVAPPERKAAQEVDDMEEFIARSATSAPASEKTARVRRPYSLTEKVCFGAGAAVLLMLLFWLGHAAVSAADGGQARSRPFPDLPMKGSLVTITQAASAWRKSVPNVDRLEQIEVIFPTPGHFEPGIIPEVSLTVDSGSTAGFLRFIFRDSEGKARGDTRVVQITGGKPVDGAAGLSASGSDAKVYCSSGLFDVDAFKSYTGDDKPRWSIEIAESNSYNSDDKDWKILGTFDVKNSLAE